jgi:predicted permease
LTYDLRFAFRALISRPGFSALAVLTLAIGIGVNAVAFSAINALLFKTHRFTNPETLGWIMMGGTSNPYGQVSWLDYQDLVASSRAFESILAHGRRPMALQEGRTVRQVWTLCVSSNYFTTLRARPAAGRLFDRTDVAASDVSVVVSYRFWQDHLNGASLAGQMLTLGGRTVSVIGVMPDDFQGPSGFFEPDLWVPIEKIAVLNLGDLVTSRSTPWLGMAGRLAPGISAAQAAADLQTVAANLSLERAEAGKARRLTYWPVLGQHPEVRGIATVAYTALGIVGLVLLLACFNVAGLLLARAADRQREISVKAALGAPRARIMRQFAFEGLLLAIVSGAAATLIAYWSADLLAAFSLPAPIPQRLHVELDRRVIGFIAALVALAGVLPTLVPAYQATRADLLRSMKADAFLGQPRSRVRSVFVIAQVAGSTLLLTAAFLFLRSFSANSNADPGFDISRLLVLELRPSDYGYTPERSRALLDSLVERVGAMPGVHHVAVSDRIPFSVGFPKLSQVSADGTDCATVSCRNTQQNAVGIGHFNALGLQLLSGRDFGPRDIQAGDSVIVNKAMASHLWPGRDAVGQWIRDGAHGRVLQVIGVVADAKYGNLAEVPADRFYRPLRNDEYAEGLTVVVRTATEPGAFAPKVQEALQALDPMLPPGSIRTMEQRMELPLWPARTAAGLFSICGILALILATVGLFGTTYLTVGQRTREFGVRAALGATRARVLRLVLGEGLWLIVPGIAIGLGCAALAGRAAASVLVGFDLTHPGTYALTAAVQSAAALLASLWPAHRATMADPILALRSE